MLRLESCIQPYRDLTNLHECRYIKCILHKHIHFHKYILKNIFLEHKTSRHCRKRGARESASNAMSYAFMWNIVFVNKFIIVLDVESDLCSLDQHAEDAKYFGESRDGNFKDCSNKKKKKCNFLRKTWFSPGTRWRQSKRSNVTKLSVRNQGVRTEKIFFYALFTSTFTRIRGPWSSRGTQKFAPADRNSFAVSLAVSRGDSRILESSFRKPIELHEYGKIERPQLHSRITKIGREFPRGNEEAAQNFVAHGFVLSFVFPFFFLLSFFSPSVSFPPRYWRARWRLLAFRRFKIHPRTRETWDLLRPRVPPRRKPPYFLYPGACKSRRICKAKSASNRS